jgi:hypothetical protein
MIPKTVKRFPACAKPWHRPFVWIDASAGEGKSAKIMRQRKNA